MIGSSSKMLSKDIVTNFRDRGSEIKVYPLSFAEYLPVAGMEKADALEEYMVWRNASGSSWTGWKGKK